MGYGYEGGVILIEIDTSGDLDPEGGFPVRYYYTDIYIIYAIVSDLYRRPRTQKDFSIRQLKEIANEQGDKKVKIGKSLFVSPKSNEHLLELAGFQCTLNTNWRPTIMNMMKNGIEPLEGNTANTLAALINTHLRSKNG